MKGLYCVYDKVSTLFNYPYPAENKETAVRSFNDAMKNHPFGEDCSLYYVGNFNDDTDGSIQACKPEFVCSYSRKVGE